MKSKVYIDSTIPSYYYDIRESTKSFVEITNRWWKTEKKNYNLFISEATVAELNNGNYPNKNKILKLINKIQILEFNREIEAIVQIYIKEFLMPKGNFGDASHLAFASYYKLDYLLTWNCNHLANANKKKHIVFINTKLGLYIPEIITPMELFSESE